ncbi:MAG: bifunctional riboflavin kinase/FAD synthetase [Thermodesulfovibrionales bacterium]|nr:bifunctional riboflavin kinase/FAD synthetase [Thermodesulfovibrionales bacterium]
MMEIKRLEDIKEPPSRTVLTIGNFDGVHIGHQKIIKEVVEKAKSIKGTSVLMTFDPHPQKFFHPEKELHLLTLCDEKARIIEKFGIQVLLCVKFDWSFASLEPEEFIKKILVDSLGVKEIIIGKDYRFGKAKRGDIELLKKEGKRYGFNVKIIPPVKIKGQTVSSTKIRALIKKGDVKKAMEFLGRPYSIEGTVISGAGRGSRILGYPTANILSGSELIPKNGVYAVRVGIEEYHTGRKGDQVTLLNGVMNIGTNPTFGNKDLSLEVHIIDFHQDILNKFIKVYFIERLRNEKKFGNPEALKRAIEKDIEQAKTLLKK